MMHTTIHESRFPNQMRGVSDGSVPGTRFYSHDNDEEFIPAGVTVQQENLSTVRIRFAADYGIRSFVMGPDDTITINVLSAD